MVGILLKKYTMEHKEEERVAVLSIKRNVLKCDYEKVKQEGLSLIRVILQAHVGDGSKVVTRVRDRGEKALEALVNPTFHRLVYELSKVPQIDERLECMLFQSAFAENLTTCRDNLATIARALDLIISKWEAFSEFFQIAREIGNSLNRDSN